MLVILSHNTKYQIFLLLFFYVQKFIEISNGRFFFFIDHSDLVWEAHEEADPNDFQTLSQDSLLDLKNDFMGIPRVIKARSIHHKYFFFCKLLIFVEGEIFLHFIESTLCRHMLNVNINLDSVSILIIHKHFDKRRFPNASLPYNNKNFSCRIVLGFLFPKMTFFIRFVDHNWLYWNKKGEH